MWQQIFSGEALVFTVPALVGTAIFLLKMGLMLMGGIGDAADMSGGGGLGAGAELDHSGSTAAFHALSIQSLTAFVMGFGWGGLAGLVGLDWPVLPSLLFGTACGAGMVWLLGLLMKAVYDLHSSGNIDIEAAVGLPGRVYVTVPAAGQGRGQVRLIIQRRSRIYDAVSSGPALPTGSTVRVVGLQEGSTVVVAAA